MGNDTRRARSTVITRRPAETLTGTAAVAAAIGLFATTEQAVAFAGLIGLIPAVITFCVDKFGSGAGARGQREYAPALDSMYSHLSDAVEDVLKTVIDGRQPKRSLATIDWLAGIVGRIDPRLAMGDAVPVGWPVEQEPPFATDEELEPEPEDGLPLPEAEGGAVLDEREPSPRRRRRTATSGRSQTRVAA